MTIGAVKKARRGTEDLLDLRNLVLEERRRVDHLLERVEGALRRKQRGAKEPQGISAPRSSPLDQWKRVIEATKDLRLSNGNLSAEKVAELYGITLSQLARWLGRSKQALSKTPGADSLQSALGYFERVARLRAVTEDDTEFRKWLRMANDTLANRAPLELLNARQWQELADKVDDMLTGMPT